MDSISVWVSEDFELPEGSGLSFYGDAGFDAPVPLGQFQGRTFMTDASGVWQGFECNNCKLYGGGSFSGVNGVSGVIVGQVGNGIPLRNLPNFLATLNIRLTTDEPVRAQNGKLYVHDGVNQNNPPSGLDCYCAEIRHPSQSQADIGEGDPVWTQVGGSSSVLGLIDSPGPSGLRPEGSLTVAARHDWYVSLSCCPARPGNRMYAFTFECEYL
jgi:hypothetical protein